MMFSLGRCSLLDFSLAVGDVSRPSLFDMLSFEAFPDQLQVSVMSIRWSRLVRGEPSLFTDFTCCSCWPGSLMSCVSFRLSRKPWRSIAPCGTWICYLMTSVPRELRPGLYRMCWALWLRCSPYQGVSQVWWCFLWVDVACLTSVWLLVMCPGLVSLTCFHSKRFQISFKWVSCRFVGWSRLVRGEPGLFT